MKQLRFIYLFLILVSASYIARLAYLQLFAKKYILNAENTSIYRKVIIPQRGYMYDRKGKLLVANRPMYEIQITPSQIPKENFDTLGFCKLLNISKEEFNTRLFRLKKSRYYSVYKPVTFESFINKENFARIQENFSRYKGFDIQKRSLRHYDVSSGANIFGYIGQVSPAYIKKDSNYYENGDFAGITGVENVYEKLLRGKKGIKYLKRDMKGRIIGPYNEGKNDISPESGKDLTLTIDFDLQQYSEKLMQNKRGGIVAIEPKTGEILTMVTSPSVDPNLFSGIDKNKNIDSLNKDTFNKPLFDRSVKAIYPPGSPFKLIMALIGLQLGILSPTEPMNYICRHGFRYGKRKFNCHGGYYYKPMPLDIAISKSCNNFFLETYRDVVMSKSNISEGIDLWSNYVKSFGMGSFLNNDLFSGSKGHVPNSAYYDRAYGKGKWNFYSALSNGVGQGELTITPLQLANITALIANKGYYYTPHIVKKIGDKPNTRFKEIKKVPIDVKHFDPVIDGMEKVFTMGTARRFNLKSIPMAGKTGTSENSHGKDHSILVLMAPIENPKIVVSVMIENSGFGATYAGPIASLIAEKYISDTVTRKDLEKRMINSSFISEYKRQAQKEEELKKKQQARLSKDSLR